MKDSYWLGVNVGVIIGSLVVGAFCIYLRDRGRDECDNKLPRTERCVQIWIDPKEAHK